MFESGEDGGIGGLSDRRSADAADGTAGNDTSAAVLDPGAPGPAAGRRERLAVLFLILALLCGLKAAYDPGLGRNSLDGAYYYQVARHVAEGDGLTTSVSLYHQGFKTLPHPTNIYPLWPLLLGFAGRVVPLPLAAAVLPEVLYLVSLLLLYPLANRLVVRLGGRSEGHLLGCGRVLDLGHVAVMLFGANAVFFNFTSLPYTEGLGFSLTFAALLALDRSAARRSLAWAAAAGALAALAYLARVQMIMVVPAVIGALALSGVRRRDRLAAAGVAAAAAALVVLPWALHLASFVDPFEPRVLYKFGAYRETPEIERFRSLRPIDPGPWSRLGDLAAGLRAAFDPRGGMTSYAGSFGLAAFAVPLALLHLAAGRRRWRALGGTLLRPEGAVVVATAAAAVAMVAPLHLLHFRFLWEWRFGFRHGLGFGLLVLVAVAYLLVHGEPLVRRAVLALVAVSLVTGSARTAGVLTGPRGWGLTPAEQELVAWLDARSPRPTVLTTNAQPLSVYSRAGFHWTECDESAEKTRQMLRLLPIDYVLVYQFEHACPFVRGVPEVAPVRRFGEGAGAVWVLAPAGARRGDREPDGGG